MNTFKLDIYKVIEGQDDWILYDTVYGDTPEECIDEANSYDQDLYHFTYPVEV